MTSTPSATAVAGPKTSGLAIASLICGLLGCTGVGAIAGVILGVVALSKIKNSGGQMTGRGLAIAGIVISAIMMLVFAVLLIVGIFVGLAMPVALSGARDQALGPASISNVHQLCMAAVMYSNENKGRFPAAQEWPQALGKFCGGERTMADPSDPTGGRAYAMNAAVGGLEMSDIRSPSQTVLFFECAPGTPPAGERGNLPAAPRHGKRYVVSFCDGHTEYVPPERIDQLIWNPKADRSGP